MQVQPYLFFEGRCEEALAFYRDALGAEVTALMRFKDSPDPPPPGMVPPGSEDKVMHAAFRIGDSTVMASDGRCSGQARFGGVSLSLSVRFVLRSSWPMPLRLGKAAKAQPSPHPALPSRLPDWASRCACSTRFFHSSGFRSWRATRSFSLAPGSFPQPSCQGSSSEMPCGSCLSAAWRDGC